MIAAALVYSLVLSYSIVDRGFIRKRSGWVAFGFIFGLGIVPLLTTILLLITRYDLAPFPVFTLVLAPVSEEIMKLIVILISGFIVQGSIRNSDMIRISGAVGLGFGLFEALGYVNAGASFNLSLLRLVTALPFHMTSGLLIGIALTERKVWIFFFAILLHSITNLFVSVNAYFPEAIIVFSVFFLLYFLSEEDYARFRDLSQTLRVKRVQRILGRHKLDS